MKFENEDMDMPVVCDCGQIFDLNDGYSSNKSNNTICKRCNKKEQLEEEIQDLEGAIYCLKEEIEFNKTQIKQYEAEFKILNEKLNKL